MAGDPSVVVGVAESGAALLIKVPHELAELAKVESSPRSEGRQMVMVLAPK